MSIFKNYNGETKTRGAEGGIVGAVIGALIGFGLSIWIFANRPEIALSFKVFAYVFFVIAGAGVFAFAGTLVGNGVPRYNPDPDQGLINRIHHRQH